MGDGSKLVAGKKGGALSLNMEEGFSFRRKRRGRQGQEYFACTNENCRATCILVSRDPLMVRISERLTKFFGTGVRRLSHTELRNTFLISLKCRNAFTVSGGALCLHCRGP
ncbi:hypothetical protein BSKO_10168 [Bryopsis sp. KO-2023]|nr:hypothetical protein BSKO_10168 [Bryopsis sp. KO-2023]